MIYIAGPFFTPEQLAIVKSVENILLKNEIEFYSPRFSGVLSDMNGQDKYDFIYNENVFALNSCDFMLACLDYKDTGTHFEVGWFAAQGKPFVIYMKDLSKLNVMLAVPACGIIDDLDDLNKAFHGYKKSIGEII